MKQLIISALFLTVGLTACNQKVSSTTDTTLKPQATTFTENDFIGAWEGELGGEMGRLVFDKEGYCTFYIDGIKKGGKEMYFEEEDKTLSLMYQFNLEADPIEFDIVNKNIATEEVIPIMGGIVQVIHNNSIKVNLNYGSEEKQKNFEYGDIVILNRVQ